MARTSSSKENTLRWASPCNGPTSTRPRTTEKDWTQHKERILQLVKERVKITEIQTTLRTETGFYATTSQYKTRLRTWKARKNFTKRQRAYIVSQVDKREKMPLFRYQGEAEYIKASRIQNVLIHRNRDNDAKYDNAVSPPGLVAVTPVSCVTPKEVELEASLDKANDNAADCMDIDKDGRNVEDEIPPSDLPSGNPKSTLIADQALLYDENGNENPMVTGVADVEETSASSSRDGLFDNDMEQAVTRALQILDIKADSGNDTTRDYTPFSEFMLDSEKVDIDITKLLGRRARAAITMIVLQHLNANGEVPSLIDSESDLYQDLLIFRNDNLETLRRDIDENLPLSFLRDLVSKIIDSKSDLTQGLLTFQNNYLKTLLERETDEQLQLPFLRYLISEHFRDDNEIQENVRRQNPELNEAEWILSKIVRGENDNSQYDSAHGLYNQGDRLFTRMLRLYHSEKLDPAYLRAPRLTKIRQIKQLSESIFSDEEVIEIARSISEKERLNDNARWKVTTHHGSLEYWSVWINIWRYFEGFLGSDSFNLDTQEYQSYRLPRDGSELDKLMEVLISLKNAYLAGACKLAVPLAEFYFQLCQLRYGDTDPITMDANQYFLRSLKVCGEVELFLKRLHEAEKLITTHDSHGQWYTNSQKLSLRLLRAGAIVFSGGTWVEAESLYLDVLRDLESLKKRNEYFSYQSTQLFAFRGLSDLASSHIPDPDKAILYTGRYIEAVVNKYGSCCSCTTERFISALLRRGLLMYARPLQHYVIKMYERLYGPFHYLVAQKIGELLFDMNDRCWEILEA